MSRPNDRVPRVVLILAALGLVAFLVFAANLALSTFRQRVGPAQRAWTPAPTRRVLTIAPVAQLTRPPSPSRTPSPTPVATETPLPVTPAPPATAEPPTPAPSPAPVASAMPPPAATPCAAPLALELYDLYDPVVLGCATGRTAVVWAAWEPFERGALLWRSDTDTAYAFLADGRWYPLAARWDGQQPLGRGEPPAGLLAPERGFGWAWGADDALFADLGWATGLELGFCAQVQPFERGFLLRSTAAATCTTEGLYNHATSTAWQPVALAAFAEGWSDTRPAAAVLPPGTPSRPESHGLFVALRPVDITLDGSPDEWPGPWLPLTAIVAGAAAWDGPADLSAMFQVGWDDDGLYVAVAVIDDSYRAGPAGTDLWQGDSLEINFDRDLAGDFDNTESNDDDTQIGLSFGPELALTLAYRWLPFNLEGPLDLPGAAVSTPEGYTAEVFIPWELFGLARTMLAPGATFGFNLAINDSDSDPPTLETVASTSPARITYDDPTQWGTLVLK